MRGEIHALQQNLDNSTRKGQKFEPSCVIAGKITLINDAEKETLTLWILD